MYITDVGKPGKQPKYQMLGDMTDRELQIWGRDGDGEATRERLHRVFKKHRPPAAKKQHVGVTRYPVAALRELDLIQGRLNKGHGLDGWVPRHLPDDVFTALAATHDVDHARTVVKAAAQRQRRDSVLAATQQHVINTLHTYAVRVTDGSMSGPGFIDSATALMRDAILEGLRLGAGHALVDSGRATQHTPWATKTAGTGPDWVDGLDGRFGLYAGSIPHAYETGYGLATAGAHDNPDNIVIDWHARPDACDMCDTWSTMVWTMATLPGLPGDGGFGNDATVCLGGPQCRCVLRHRLATPGEVDAINARDTGTRTPQQLADADRRIQDVAAVAEALTSDDPNGALARVLAAMADDRAERQRGWLTGLLKDILTAATRGANAVRQFLVTKEYHPGELRDERGRWTVVGAATHELTQLLGKATSNHDIERSYGEAVDSDAFAEGAYAEVGTAGDVHIDLAGAADGTFHVFADMSQDDAAQFSESIWWALSRADEAGHRRPDPVNGLLDWHEIDGRVVGYTPGGRIHLGQPAAPHDAEGNYLPGHSDLNDMVVLDLAPDEAKELARVLSRLAAVNLEEYDTAQKAAKPGRRGRVWQPCRVRMFTASSADYANPPSAGVVKAAKTPATAAVVAQMRENYPTKALGWMGDAQWSGPTDVPLDRVDFDDMAKWAASHDKARVKHFRKKLRNGGAVKPVVAVQEPGGDKVKVIDGHHRTLAYRKEGQPVRAYVGEVASDGGPWDETHSFQVHQGGDPRNGEDGPAAAGLAVRAADTGRVLMLQRALPVDGEDDDPAAGTFEMPGGKLDPGETPIGAARREWAEETGCPVPKGTITGQWASPDGVYQGFVLTIPSEDAVPIFGDRDHVTNPDDPDGDRVEALVWWDPAHLVDNPAVRAELADALPAVLRALKVPAVEKGHVFGGEAADGIIKCLTCGCDMPHNGHGDHRHITIEELEAAAEAAGISVEEAAANLQHTLHHEQRVVDKTAATPGIPIELVGLVDLFGEDGHEKAAQFVDAIHKVEEGAVGRYRARHLIRWFERGEGAARIGWGTPGDFDRCVTIASEHMRPDQAKGFCNLRHHGALGYYPATHAAMERGHQ